MLSSTKKSGVIPDSFPERGNPGAFWKVGFLLCVRVLTQSFLMPLAWTLETCIFNVTWDVLRNLARQIRKGFVKIISWSLTKKKKNLRTCRQLSRLFFFRSIIYVGVLGYFDSFLLEPAKFLCFACVRVGDVRVRLYPVLPQPGKVLDFFLLFWKVLEFCL